jgi:hypothetical protein
LLDELIADIRDGESRSLVLPGEAGIGQTALVKYLVASASALTVLRAVGADSEMELAYASLHQLCSPLLDELEKAPGASARRALDHFRLERRIAAQERRIAQSGAQASLEPGDSRTALP